MQGSPEDVAAAIASAPAGRHHAVGYMEGRAVCPSLHEHLSV